MTLSGNLSFVPIDEVLRLLTRSRQQGSVDVFGSGLSGRVFVGRGGIDLATIWDDDNLHRHLVNSGCADADMLRRITARETTLAAIAESNNEIVDLVREVTVESLYQMAHHGDSFEVREGVTTPYASPKSFELERLLEDSRDREKAWEKVKEVVPDLTGAVSFRRDLGEREEVTVKVDDWKVLSEIGTGASVQDIADQLGTTEFWAARVAARLLNDDLINMSSRSETGFSPVLDQPVEPMTSDEPAAETAPSYESFGTDEAEVDSYQSDVSSYGDEVEETADFDDEVYGEVESDFEADTPVEADTEYSMESDPDADVDPSESWWQEPEDEVEEVDEEPQTPEVVAEGLSEIPSVDGDEDVEEDTEAFLEKVFSELESSEPESEEGHGLLRRRRMGTLRDFSSDS